MTDKVPQSPPVRMEVRVGGKVKFANIVYAPRFEQDEANLVIRADLQPTLIDPPRGVVFARDDPREGPAPVMKVHDGRGEVAAPKPKSRPKKAEP